ncbi:MAG: LysE family translocator [Desulfobacula sp.]|nr:LysE family translocator [Desulfobacula sp.]
MTFNSWFAFVIMMTAIAYTPGPMTMFAMSSSVQNGFYKTLPGIVGGSVAYIIQMIVVYLGLGVIVQNSTLVFNTIKWAGVVYLILLGIKNWRLLITEAETIRTDLNVPLFKQFSIGWATGMSNPKSVLVFTVLFPQFIDPGQYSNHFAILAATFFIIQGSSAFTYALFGSKVYQWMRKRNLTKIQNKVTAAILFCAGGILAFSKK